VADGRPASDIDALLAADNQPPLVSLVFRPGLSSASQMAEQPPSDELPIEVDQLIAVEPPPAAEKSPADGHPVIKPVNPTPADTEPGVLVPTARRLMRGDPARIPGVEQGVIGVQDEGSQAVTLALAAVPIEGPDARWLDICAGPGGKAALLGALAAQRGARLVANEVSEHRAELVRQSLKAIPAAAIEAVRVGDGRELGAQQPGAFDRVLVDAPCSGLGALRRRPEARWRRQPSDVAALRPLQRELLESAIKAARVGGVVGYVTCSPHIAETTVVVDDAIANLKKQGLAVEKLGAADALRGVVLPDVRDTINQRPDQAAQLWPHIQQCDAMYLALLRRVA